MKPIASAADLDEVRSLPCALVFIHVIWSGQARDSEAACRNFLETLRSEYPDEEIPVFRIDLSDQKGEVWDSVRNWLRKENCQESSLTYGGNGAMLWLRRGKVAASKLYFASVGLDGAMAITRDVLGRDDGSGTSDSPNLANRFVRWVFSCLPSK